MPGLSQCEPNPRRGAWLGLRSWVATSLGYVSTFAVSTLAVSTFAKDSIVSQSPNLALICQAACRGAKSAPSNVADWVIETAENLAYLVAGANLDEDDVAAGSGQPTLHDVAALRTHLTMAAADFWHRDLDTLERQVTALLEATTISVASERKKPT